MFDPTGLGSRDVRSGPMQCLYVPAVDVCKYSGDADRERCPLVTRGCVAGAAELNLPAPSACLRHCSSSQDKPACLCLPCISIGYSHWPPADRLTRQRIRCVRHDSCPSISAPAAHTFCTPRRVDSHRTHPSLADPPPILRPQAPAGLNTAPARRLPCLMLLLTITTCQACTIC
jgi:hypothetical protein